MCHKQHLHASSCMTHVGARIERGERGKRGGGGYACMPVMFGNMWLLWAVYSSDASCCSTLDPAWQAAAAISLTQINSGLSAKLT